MTNPRKFAHSTGTQSTSALPISALGQSSTWNYRPLMVLGAGSFATVYLSMGRHGERVALKKVRLDGACTQELSILQSLSSPFCSQVLDYFYSHADGESFLWIVTEMMPESLGAYLRRAAQLREPMPRLLTKLFAFQLFAGLAHLHALGVTHRDVKADNCLVDGAHGRLKIADFGIAKRIGKGDASGSYVASRFYRAPELLLGCTRYRHAVDIWAAGCVVAEMLLAMPMFQGASNADQLDQIMRVIGPPRDGDAESFEHALAFPRVEQICSLRVALPRATEPELLRLLERIFVYNPGARPTAEECMASTYFDELFAEGTRLPGGGALPHLGARET
jgi:glycogen synthase kinase 3 beta